MALGRRSSLGMSEETKTEPCAVCRDREGTDDTRRLAPYSRVHVAAQLSGGRMADSLVCLDCGTEWTLVQEVDGPHTLVRVEPEAEA